MAAIPFFASLILLISFLGFRLWEEGRGVRLFGRFRESFDNTVSSFYHRMVISDIPTEYRRIAVAFLHQLVHAVVVLTADGLRVIERQLTRLSYRMRRGAPNVAGKSPSEFLKTITPDKKEAPHSEEPTH